MTELTCLVCSVRYPFNGRLRSVCSNECELNLFGSEESKRQASKSLIIAKSQIKRKKKAIVRKIKEVEKKKQPILKEKKRVSNLSRKQQSRLSKLIEKQEKEYSKDRQLVIDRLQGKSTLLNQVLAENVKLKRELSLRKEPPFKESFYTSKEWRELRYFVLKQQGRKCRCCGAENTIFHVDHIKPRSLFPELELDPSNLQVLCVDCNIGKSNKDSIKW